MNAAREVIQHGYVLVRDGRIAAVWKGAHPPDGVDLSGVVRVPLGRRAHIYPGLINLHDHPFYDVLPLWQPPSSHRQPELGQAAGYGAVWQPISVECGGADTAGGSGTTDCESVHDPDKTATCSAA